jgi:hypothetical protein
MAMGIEAVLLGIPMVWHLYTTFQKIYISPSGLVNKNRHLGRAEVAYGRAEAGETQKLMMHQMMAVTWQHLLKYLL